MGLKKENLRENLRFNGSTIKKNNERKLIKSQYRITIDIH